jgi:branched-subunit amino acid ABC-type transport system permease component
MVPRVTIYLHCIVGIGIYLFFDGLMQFRCADPQEFFAYLALALLGATLKLKLPKVRANVSTSFAFILIGIANFSLGEAVLMGAAATLVQCLWRPKGRRKPQQVLFNLGATVIGVTVAYNPSHYELSRGLHNLPSMLPLAALLYFIANTGLVSGIIALSEDEPFRAVWRNLTQHLIAYYLVGGFIATLIIAASRLWGWQSGILILPLLYLTHRYYRVYLLRTTRA